MNFLQKGFLNLKIYLQTEARIPKYFRNYQNPVELLKNVRDGNVNRRLVLKSQINFKSEIGVTKRRNPDLKNRTESKCSAKYLQIF